ncbi:hypothetical protein Mapa_014072 [Marchantia paleacea]|nr:hypothetical protein Mapa_014072 [Marchantia paleacea]
MWKFAAQSEMWKAREPCHRSARRCGLQRCMHLTCVHASTSSPCSGQVYSCLSLTYSQ